jgi:glycosyltransferase involved in cell wall biosynthesis
MYLQQHTALYAAFDIFPSSKGAATHINYFAEALFDYKQNGWLHVLGDEEMPSYQNEENNIEITRFNEQIPNFLARTAMYGQELYENLCLQKSLEICHFRDIWSGLAILGYQTNVNQATKTVFEVNSLPSIELPYRYRLSSTSLANIKELEKICLSQADAIVVPSEVLRQFLVKQGVANHKITCITNGATVPAPPLPSPAEEGVKGLPENYIIYFGALQSWQGIEVLLRAFALLRDNEDLYLVICSSLKEKFSRNFQKLAEKLGISSHILWQHRLSKTELQSCIFGAKLSVAPLTECSRNLEQGCCPLKILESMACGIPVIASDLPVTREIITQHENGKLVRADRPADLSRAIRLLLEETAFCQELGVNARKTVIEKFMWADKQKELIALYQKL